MHSAQYAVPRQAQSAYQLPPPHRQPSSSSSGSYPSPTDRTSQHSSGPNYAYGHRSNASLGGSADVKREYDEPPPASNRYYTSGYGYSTGGNSGYGEPPSSTQYYGQSSQGAHYQTSAQFGSGSANYNYSSVQRSPPSPPVSPVTSTPDYFINQSSSSSASSPTSPASPVTGYHYSWQSTHTHQPDGSNGHYTPTELPPQYNPQNNPFQPPSRPVTQMEQALVSSTTAPRPFVCDDCGMNFSRQHDLKRHLFSHSTPQVKKTFPCAYCGKYLSRRDAIKRHVVSKQCPVAAEKNYGWPVPEDFVHATPIPPTTTRTRGSSTSEDARLRRESITNPYPRVDPIVREAERAEIERLERNGTEARIVVDPRSGGGYPVAYAAGRP